jgi:predicted Zn-dependent peptidase
MKIGWVERKGSLVNVTAVIPLPPDWGIEDGAWIVAQALVDRDPTNHSPRAELWRQCLASGCELTVTTDSTAVTVAVETLASNCETALKAAGSLLTPENLNVEAMNRAVAAWRVSHDSQDAAARANQMLGRILGGGDPETAIPPPDENHLELLRKSIFNSGRATILVAGDIEPQRLETAIKQFIITLPPSEMIRRLTDTKADRKLNTPQRFVVYFMDAPGRAQALILAGQRLGELTAETLLKARLAAAIVGARVNANLREQHQWSYGAQARLGAACDGSAALLLSTEVQTEQTAAAIAEIRRELEQHEPTPSDLTRLPFYRRDMSQQIVGGSATVAGVNAALAELARRKLSLTKYPELLSNASTLDAVSLQEALRLIDPKAVVFVLLGDSVRVRSQLDAAGVTIIPIHQ